MVEFENSNVSVSSMLTVIPTSEGFVVGTHIYVDSTPNKNKKFQVPEGGIWMKQLNDTFQNKDNFVQGIKHVSELAAPKAMKTCFDILDWMTENYEKKNSEDYCRFLGFFCELGVWKNSAVRDPGYYDDDFNKYLNNCGRAYGIPSSDAFVSGSKK